MVPHSNSLSSVLSRAVEGVCTGLRTLDELYGRRQAKARKLEEEAAERATTDDEVTRTCPWCGTLFDTVILMEEHEVDCD